VPQNDIEHSDFASRAEGQVLARRTGQGRLRRVLALDAAGMAVVGIAYLAAAGPLGRLFGPSTLLVAAIGGVMLAAGVGIATVARLGRIPDAAVRWVIGGGAGWIALSLTTLALDALGHDGLGLTATGVAWTWLQIAPVAVFAALEGAALRSSRGAS
jgi:hypothetical protein